MKKSLPWPFWVLIFLAIVVAMTLVIGLVMENKAKFSFPSAEKNAEPTKGTDPARDASAAKADTGADSPKPTAKCTAAPLDLKLPEGLQLVGWEPNALEFGFWTLDLAAQKLKKWTFTESGTAVQMSGEQALLCADRQESTCLLPGPKKEHFAEIHLVDRLAWARLVDSADDPTWIALRKTGPTFRIFNVLGFCGYPLRDKLRLFVEGLGERQSLIAIPTDPTFLLNYSVGTLRPYGSDEVPLHPSMSYKLNTTGAENFNCNDAAPGEQTVDADYLDGRLSVIAKHSRLMSRPDLWMFRFTPRGISSQGRIAGESLSGPLHSARWRDEGMLSLNSANFFQTQEQSLELKVDSGRVVKGLHQEASVGQTLPSREEIVGGKRLERAMIYFMDARHTKPAFSRGTSDLVPLELSTPGDKPNWLWSARSADTSVLLAQAANGEPVHAFTIRCLAN